VVERSPNASGRLASPSAALLTGGGHGNGIAIAGVAAATRLARLLDSLFEEVLLVGGEPPADAPGRRVPDLPGPACPLRGVASALAAAAGERVLVLATDHACVTPDLLLALVARPEADAVVPRDAGGRHPLCAVYRREVALDRARVQLAGERLSLADLLAAVDTAELAGPGLAEVDPAGAALLKVDNAEDWARAQTAITRA